MFFTNVFLAKKGSLARIWLAAHLDKKLTKAHVFETNIEKAVDKILDQTKVRLALRTSGHLLLGVVKIYSRKTKYLLSECSETCSKMRLAFRPYAVIDMPDDRGEAEYDAITNQEIFHDFDAAGMDISLNQSRYEDITLMEETPDKYNLDNQFGFGDEESEIEAYRGAPIRGAAASTSAGDLEHVRGSTGSDGQLRLSDLGMGGNGGLSGNRIDITPYLEEDGSGGRIRVDDGADVVMMDDQDNFVMPPPPIPPPAGMSSPTPVMMDDPRTPTAADQLPAVSPIPPPSAAADAAARPSDVNGMTTLLSNPADGFVLEPLDENTILGASRRVRKRRRCLMVDEHKSITNDAFAKQLKNHKDLVRPLDAVLGPRTKRQLYLKEHGSVDHLLSYPALEFASTKLYEKTYKPNLQNRVHPLDQDSMDPSITLAEYREEEPIVAQPQPQAPAQLQLTPIVEEAERERQSQGGQVPSFNDDQPMEIVENLTPAVIDQQPNDDHQFVQPLPPAPDRSTETPRPRGDENDGPLPFFNSVLISPFVMPASGGGQGDQGVLADRNDGTPLQQMMSSTPRKSPRKSEQRRLSQEEQPNAEEQEAENLENMSRISRASVIGYKELESRLGHQLHWCGDQLEQPVNFRELLNEGDDRKTVARKFYALLQLKKEKRVLFEQDEPYGPITITKFVLPSE